MKRISRRKLLLLAAAAIPVSLHAARQRVAGSPRNSVVALRRVSAFSGPFVVGELKPGRRLDVALWRGKAFVSMGEHGLGWLPAEAARSWKRAAAAGSRADVLLESVGRDDRGRLALFVSVAD